MKKVNLILINNGENVGSFSPHCFLESFTGNLNETVIKCRNWDDNGQEICNLYSQAEIEIPEWMSESDYIRLCVKYHYAKVTSLGFSKELNEIQFMNFVSLSPEYQYFIGWLFKGNTKSKFKLDMRELVTDWLNNENNNFKQPLSLNQFNYAAKYCPLYEAKQIQNRLYWNKQYWLA